MRILKGHRSGQPVRNVAFSPDGKKLASVARDRTIRLWDIEAGTSTVAPAASPAHGLAFAPDGKELAWSGGSVHLWDLARGTVRDLPLGESDYGFSVGFSPDGRLLAVVGRRVHLWNMPAGTPLSMGDGGDQAWGCLAFAPDGKTLATAHKVRHSHSSYQYSVRLWDPTTRRVGSTLVGHGAYTTGLAFAPNSRVLAATCGQPLLVWDVATGATLVHHKINKQHFMDVIFTPDGRFLLLARRDKTVRVWDTQTWREQAAFDWDIGAIVSVAVAPDGMRAAAGGDKGKIVVWDLDL
jgi:WD40 repeat protein